MSGVKLDDNGDKSRPSLAKKGKTAKGAPYLCEDPKGGGIPWSAVQPMGNRGPCTTGLHNVTIYYCYSLCHPPTGGTGTTVAPFEGALFTRSHFHSWLVAALGLGLAFPSTAPARPIAQTASMMSFTCLMPRKHMDPFGDNSALKSAETTIMRALGFGNRDRFGVIPVPRPESRFDDRANRPLTPVPAYLRRLRREEALATLLPVAREQVEGFPELAELFRESGEDRSYVSRVPVDFLPPTPQAPATERSGASNAPMAPVPRHGFGVQE